MADPNHIKWLLEGVESWNERRRQKDFEPDLRGANIYEEFQQAGKINHEGNLPLSRINLRRANLAKSCFSTPYTNGGADFRASNFWSANLQDAQLANSRLDGAVLNGSMLDRANLNGAKLCAAKMFSAQMCKTDLFGADLTDADLSLAYLGDANLSCATLLHTNLSTAILTGADLTWSRPWRAKLYDDAEANTPDTSEDDDRKKCICSVANLIEECMDLQAYHPEAVLYFRGEHSDNWDLRPSVMRYTKEGAFIWRSRESDMLVDLTSRRPQDFDHTTTALAQWVMAQHHGLKTRLLDVTRNPLVALFAACESECNNGRLHVFSVPKGLIKSFYSDTISILANFARLTRGEQDLLLGWTGDDVLKREPDPHLQYSSEIAMRRLYHLIRQEKPHFEHRINPRDLFRVFIVEPQQSFERIRAQSGAFLISAFHERFERSEVLQWNSGIPVYNYRTVEIPKEKKRCILKELKLLNVTRETIFPGLDEAAKAITDIQPNWH